MKKSSEFRSPNLAPTDYHRAIINVAVVLGIALGCFMLLSNILAIKIWKFGPFILDGGFILFPLTYVIGDVMVLIFGKKIADTAANCTSLVALIGLASFFIANLLPDAPGVYNPSVTAAFGMSGQVILGSVIAFWVSRHINSRILERRIKAGKNKFWSAYLSSFAARVFDSLLFTFIAFWGRNTIGELAYQAIYSLIGAMILEFILNKPKFCICNFIIGYLKKVKRHQEAALKSQPKA